MTEMQKTIAWAAAAVVLALAAFLMAPKQVTPEAFMDQGQRFFPDFTDPNLATTLEVIDYNEATGSAKPFKVTFNKGRWTIPSHHDYPADAKDRLAKTAAGVIDLKKDDFRTDNVADQEGCGVIDPLDESAAGLSGRGKRITLKGKSGNVLADLIIGKKVLSHPGFRFVRVPGQSRIYASRVDLDISTRFQDWIDPDLLRIEKDRVNKLELRDYSINERTLSVDQRDNLVLARKGSTWKADRMKGNQMVDSSRMADLLSTLDDLTIVGVRPKPKGLSASLRTNGEGTSISQADQLSLQNKGYYLSRDGQLLSNEGELQFWTDDGVHYMLRFGEVLYGTGLSVTAGTDESNPGNKSSEAENRYLFVTAEFNPKQFGPEPPKPTNEDYVGKTDSLLTDSDKHNKSLKEAHDKWQNKFDAGKKKAVELNARYANWYYVIPATDFEKLDLSRKDLIIRKKKA